MTQDILECYKILDIEPGATAEQVRRTYIDLAGVWDPEKYIGNPSLYAIAKKKRQEIESAYKSISHFLPELRADYEPTRDTQEQTRDFKEMTGRSSGDVSGTAIALVICASLLLVFAWGYHIYRQTLMLPTESIPGLDLDLTSSSSSTVNTGRAVHP